MIHPIRERPRAQQRVVAPFARMRTPQIALAYLGAIALAELVTALMNPAWGVVAHVVILGNLVIHSVLARSHWDQGFFLSMTVAPLIRILSLGMPLGVLPQQWWYALSSLPLFTASFLLMREIPLLRRLVGIQLPSLRHLPLTVAVTASGVLLGWLEYVILKPAPLVDSLSISTIALPSVILLIGTGVIEELIFRGILQATTIEVLGVWPGIAYVSVLFGILHTGHLSVLDVAFVIGVALYFSVVVRRTRTLLGVSLAHGLTNIMLFVVFPLVLR